MTTSFLKTPCMLCREPSCFGCERVKFITPGEEQPWIDLGWEAQGKSADGFVKIAWPHAYEDLRTP